MAYKTRPSHGPQPRRTRMTVSRGTPSYQLGHYEMVGEKGNRRSVFKVEVHLGEYESADEALREWPGEIEHLRRIGRNNKANRLEEKLERLRRLRDQEESNEIV